MPWRGEGNRRRADGGFLNRRFDPHFAAVRAAIDEGRIGPVEMVQITSRDPGPPPVSYIKSSGGILRDMTIHDFDMARFLLGEEPDTIFATASVLVDPAIGEAGDFDSVSVILTTASGRQCSISNSRRATYGYDQRIEVLGAEGAVAAENQRPVSIEIANAQGFTPTAAARFLHDPLHGGLCRRDCKLHRRHCRGQAGFSLGRRRSAARWHWPMRRCSR